MFARSKSVLFSRSNFAKAVDVSAFEEYDAISQDRTPLDRFFYPEAVAVVGATDRAGAVGRSIMSNLLTDGFSGELYPINPKRPSVMGKKAYKKVSECPQIPDLVVMITPASTIPKLVGECVDFKVPSIITISAGFREVGAAGRALETEIEAHLARSNGRTRMLGPNCIGMMNPGCGLNATFATQICTDGHIALVSQSGAMLSSILDWALKNHVGFSYMISVGSMLDLSWGDLLDHLGKDKRTKAISIYMETVGDARSFLSAAREVALNKPILVLKAGRSEQAAAAAVSHTGSLAGSDAVLDQAFKRCGIVRVARVEDMFELPKCLTHMPIPRGPRLCIVTNAGGPGVLATDALIEAGGELSKLSEDDITALNKFVPPEWSHANPVDILGSAPAEMFSATLDVVRKSDCDGILVIAVPLAQMNGARLASAVKAAAVEEKEKPILVCYQGGEELDPGRYMLDRANIPVFQYSDDACRMFSYMWEYQLNINMIYERPTTHGEDSPVQFRKKQSSVDKIINHAYKDGREVLTEEESKRVLDLYDIPVVQTTIAETEDAAVEAAGRMSYPVVLKIHSKTITHKSDVGGVQLNLKDEAEVRHAFTTIKGNVERLVGDLEKNFLGVTVQPMLKSGAYELLLGCNTDPQFGPVIVFGTGGFLVEVFRDTVLGLPPLNKALVERMVAETKAAKALSGIRGQKPADMDLLSSILVRFSHLVVNHRRIKEFDINPILADSERIIAVDARVVLHPQSVKDVDLPQVAIRPFPVEYTFEHILKNGEEVHIRPIRPEDEAEVEAVNREMSNDSVLGYFGREVPIEERVTHERMTKVCHTDYNRAFTLVVDEVSSGKLVGVARLVRSRTNKHVAHFKAVIRDSHQNLGIGRLLFDTSMHVAKCEQIQLVTTDVMDRRETEALKKQSERAKKLLEISGFEFFNRGDGVLKAVKDLTKLK